MPNRYPPAPGKSATPGHPALRSRIADAIDSHIQDRSGNEIARDLGVSGSTISRRGSDLHSWPLINGLDLGVQSRPLRDAIVAYMDGDVPAQGEGVRATGALMTELGLTSTLTGEIAKALQDGRVSSSEARIFLQLLADLRKHHDAILIPALMACAEAK